MCHLVIFQEVVDRLIEAGAREETSEFKEDGEGPGGMEYSEDLRVAKYRLRE